MRTSKSIVFGGRNTEALNKRQLEKTQKGGKTLDKIVIDNFDFTS